jgi:hypothetical protein
MIPMFYDSEHSKMGNNVKQSKKLKKIVVNDLERFFIISLTKYNSLYWKSIQVWKIHVGFDDDGSLFGDDGYGVALVTFL